MKRKRVKAESVRGVMTQSLLRVDKKPPTNETEMNVLLAHVKCL